ncbi:hypothetical protein [Nostoc sp.]|uniref:hypothetical protein n=1 Tax=Nostoc sp. TaxID=1180 RepID=UPI002FF9E5C9
MTILCTFKVMLFTGFVGSAYWSTKKLPIPYPSPFWFQREPIFFIVSLISLGANHDDSNTPSILRFTYGYFAQWTPT